MTFVVSKISKRHLMLFKQLFADDLVSYFDLWGTDIIYKCGLSTFSTEHWEWTENTCRYQRKRSRDVLSCPGTGGRRNHLLACWIWIQKWI